MNLKFLDLPLLILSFSFAGCSVPNLESPQCTQSRDAVREFYSIHFGNEMKPSEAYLKLRKQYITENFSNVISKQINQSQDFFTLTDDYGKAFRIGKCKDVEQNKTDLEVLIFWKTDTRTEQKAIHAEAVNEGGKWLINKIEN